MSIMDRIVLALQWSREAIQDFGHWHADLVEDFAEKYDFSAYGMAVLGFVKGVALVLILQWIF